MNLMDFHSKNFLKRWSIAACLAMLMAGTVSCVSTSNDTEEEVEYSNEELSRRYRDLVHSQFLNRARRNGADTRYLILVDYSIPSNDYRFFLWDAEEDRIIEKFWCAHGFGGGSTPERPVFSNRYGSNCSSLGWYLIDKGTGVSAQWGYTYHAVDGLDASNSNARRREILIHPWSSVSHDYKAKIDRPMNLDYRSAGCFTITDEGFKTIDTYIKSCDRRMLLFAFYGVD